MSDFEPEVVCRLVSESDTKPEVVYRLVFQSLIPSLKSCAVWFQSLIPSLKSCAVWFQSLMPSLKSCSVWFQSLIPSLKSCAVWFQSLIPSLKSCDPEEYGDIYLDVAEALMEKKHYTDALALLNILTNTKNYCLVRYFPLPPPPTHTLQTIIWYALRHVTEYGK